MDASPVILVVEDSDEDFEATCRAFRRVCPAHTLRRCVDGESALDYLRREGAFADPASAPPATLVLLDLNLNGTDGREVLERIKSSEETRCTPVVVLTTSSAPRDVEGCYRAGANSYVVKPVSFERFIQSVRSLYKFWFETATVLTRKD